MLLLVLLMVVLMIRFGSDGGAPAQVEVPPEAWQRELVQQQARMAAVADEVERETARLQGEIADLMADNRARHRRLADVIQRLETVEGASVAPLRREAEQAQQQLDHAYHELQERQRRLEQVSGGLP